ncbi:MULTISPECIES: apolipoprotein N-acyltransferase [unclassified Treponema]|uniref:apolipoprotein N-acyltransferase n=1 Tax=unclassified Treponema TaxID=2638727 RepID=UPI0005301295|nr:MULTISPECIES: apolipoprotein N-acyltransferase [unclassified Treponema]AIW88466.1 acyltransferase [Treponema sp. OMZ 838]UTC51520.1 apolipoprotein N-acyltransferase [Treponema sp. OMZ 855]
MQRSRSLAYWGVNAALLVSSSALFAFSQPGFLISTGLPFLAYIIFIPLFILVRRISLPSSFLWGGIYGVLNYCIFSYWLWGFHPLAMYIVALEYFFYYMLTVPLLKLADICFPRYGFIVQWLIWIGYEYVKTLGFLGFSYGLVGYSQWQFIPLIQIASVFGVWGVSALVCFPSAWIAAGIKPYCTESLRNWLRGFRVFAYQERIPALIWCLCVIAALIYGVSIQQDYKDLPTARIALIQPNSDPWVGGVESYKRDFKTLKKLSDQAITDNPDLALVVWPETAFIPRIDWHYRYREDRNTFELVHELLAYLDTRPVPFLIGNDDAVKTVTDAGVEDRFDYNAALLFRPQENVLPPQPDRYQKMHLVPFTEHFPYKKTFPAIYEALVANDTHFWEKGTDPTVFSVNGLDFSVPICFEDTFGYITRRFARHGAKLFVNMSNDAWAKSVACQYQHLSMSVFRAVETRLPMVRATASGQTAAIDPHGHITAMMQPFIEGYLCVDVPAFTTNSNTWYVLWGDILGLAAAIAAVCLLIIGSVRTILNSRKTA